jgi:thymidylate synthase
MKDNYLDEWYQALLSLLVSEDQSFNKSDRTGTGTKSLFGIQFRHNMSDGFPLLTTKKMAWKTMVVELLWFLRGETNIKFLLDYDCHIWDGDAYKNYSSNVQPWEPHLNMNQFIERIKNNEEFRSKWGELGPIYGKQWRSWKYQKNEWYDGKNHYEEESKSIDQIQNLINELKTNPDSRRLMVNAWNVGEIDQMVLPPCHYGFQVYTRKLTGEEMWDLLKKKVGEERFKSMVDDIVPFGGGLSEELESYNIPKRAISLMWNQRSVDTFLGLPFNIASYGLLLEIIAKEVNMVPDQLIGNLGDVHLYKNHIEQAKEQISRTPYELPTVKITERNWYMHEAVKEHLGEKTLDEKLKSYRPDCFELIGYESHPKIKAPLSN